MNRKLLLLGIACMLLLLGTQPVSAHVLLRDAISDTGAVLHVNPDDDPVAGEKASLFFDIQDRSLANKQAEAKLTITDDEQNETDIPVRVSGSSVSVDVTFPRQGLYQIDLVITQGSKTLHEFKQSQRINRGTLGSTLPDTAPVWAKIGILLAVLVGAATAIVAYNRRHDITKYSKF